MDKKKSVFIAIIAVILVATLAVVLANRENDNNVVNEPNDNQVQNNENQELEAQLEEEEIAVSEENILVINEDGFTPDTLFGEAGKRVFVTFEATDGQRHIIASEDPALADVFLVVVEENEEPKSVAFMAPEAGTYSFYVDETGNAGTIIIR